MQQQITQNIFDSPLITTEIKYDNQVYIISINRPDKRNAVNRPTAEQLTTAFKKFEKDEKAKVAILTGVGHCFCAGADLSSVSKESRLMNRLEKDGDGPMGPSRLLLSKPVIAAISGYAVAGGLELACWCDLRVAEKHCTMGVFCRRVGVPLIDGGTIRLPQLIGLSRAMDLILTGRGITGEEAYQWGLVNRLVESKYDVLPEAEKLALELCKLPQNCLRNDRMSTLENVYHEKMEQLLMNEFNKGMHVIKSGETYHGAYRFSVEKKGRHGSAMEVNDIRSKL